MTKYPIGIQTFSKIIEEGWAYVDKTAFVYQLGKNGGYYFLSRPRRFGKSLLISTLEAFFLGKKELFKGLAIEQLETEWKQYPVFHLDLNTGLYNAPPVLNERLNHHLKGWEDLYGIVPTDSQSLATRFEVAIKRAYEQTGLKVVILVDEYDKPLLQSLGNKELQDTYRAMLKSFYGVAKSMDAYIQFAFFTGVTKISVDSLLGDLNNITNISLDKRFTGICGFTEEEIRDNFDTKVELMAMKNHLTKEDCYAKLKENYAGYHFCEASVGIYNPFSLMNAISTMKINDFWFEADTETILTEVLKQNNYTSENLKHDNEADFLLYETDMFGDSLFAVLFQHGYLTIKEYDERFQTYHSWESQTMKSSEVFIG